MFGIQRFRTALCVLFSVGLIVHTHALPTWPWGDSDEVPNNFKSQQCAASLSRDKLPLCSTPGTCLSAPPWNSRPVAVVLGIGTQNYTCSSPDQRPTANGAIADLYDITCLVSTTPKAAHYTSRLAFRANVQKLQEAQAGKVPLGLGFTQIGYHHFTPNARTAVFELNWGIKDRKFVGGRLEGIPAPADAVEGTVDWLKLGRTKGLENQSTGIKYIYRVHTAGGKPPATCKGIKGEYTVDYATEYWFFD